MHSMARWLDDSVQWRKTMLSIPPTIFRRNRRAARKEGASPPLPSGPLVPVAVTDVGFGPAAGGLNLTLDVNPGYELVLPEEGFDPMKWTVLVGNRLYQCVDL